MTVTCDTCGKTFKKKLANIKASKKHYCCKDCQNKGQITRIACNCDKCGKPITVLASVVKKSKHKHNFCSKSCACSFNNTAFRSSTNNPNWKGSDYIKVAFLAYNPVCSICSFDNRDALGVHHIDTNRDNNDTDNLIILCANCHRIVHKDHLEITNEIKLSRKLNS